MQVNQ